MGNKKWMASCHPFFVNVHFVQSKKDSSLRKTVFLGEGIFTMGLVKTIYNVLGGFYVLYNSINFMKSLHKLLRIFQKFSCIFDKRIVYVRKNA